MKIILQKRLDASQLLDEVEIALCWALYHKKESRAVLLNELWELLNNLQSENLAEIFD